MTTNITFNSNIYTLKEGLLPYADRHFISHIFDPEKLKLLQRFTSLPKIQEECIKSSAICTYLKLYEKDAQKQYFVLTENLSEEKVDYPNGKYTLLKIRQKCKCPATDCPLFSQCRPGEKDLVQKEKAEFRTLKKAEKTNFDDFYPIVMGIERLKETYDSKAFELIANTNLKKHYEKKEVGIIFLDTGNGNSANWENFDLSSYSGSYNSYYQGNVEAKSVVPIIKVDTSKKIINPMLEYQKKENKNRDNPFFKNNKA